MARRFFLLRQTQAVPMQSVRLRLAARHTPAPVRLDRPLAGVRQLRCARRRLLRYAAAALLPGLMKRLWDVVLAGHMFPRAGNSFRQPRPTRSAARRIAGRVAARAYTGSDR